MKKLARQIVLLVLALPLILSIGAPAQAAPPIYVPFPGGTVSRIIQGYHGGTHRGVERLSLDLVVEGGATSGAPVVSPVSGRVEWAYGPWVGNGCIAVSLDDGSAMSVMLCHVILDRPFAGGEPIALGQRLGYVGPAGTVGNNGTPHVHMQLYRRSGGRIPLPFSSSGGHPLDGVDLPDTGRYNAHAGTVIQSTIGVTAAPAADTRTVTGSTSSRGAARPADAYQISAMVRGTGYCLYVLREPDPEAESVACLLAGTRVTIVEGPVRAGGYSFYRLSGWGWVVGDYLRPIAN